ncbi:hypothetical protein C0993_007701 [Termitomyces sp. T159_Od127]|nr:hypothetical protein C0993_007701 [Termitomyces sp. T159_Od127]
MSYASVAAANAPPPEHQVRPSQLPCMSPHPRQPQPDPALLNTTPPTAPPIDQVDNTANKVNLVTPVHHVEDDDDDDDNNNDSNYRPRRERGNRHLKEVEAEGLYLWESTKHRLLQPGVAGGLVGLVNIGLLIGAGRAFYTQPHLRQDRTVISSTVAAAFALLSVEGYAAEKYRQTPQGQAEARRAKREGALIYKNLKEGILRPGVLGGLAGLVNTAVLGAVGYFSYVHWDRPTWDRRIVSAVAAGLLALWGAEGWVAAK